MKNFLTKLINSLFNDPFQKKILDNPPSLSEIPKSEFQENDVPKTIPVNPLDDPMSNKGKGHSWVTIIITPFKSINKTSVDFIRSLKEFLVTDRGTNPLVFAIYRVYLSENELGDRVVTLKLIFRTKNSMSYYMAKSFISMFETQSSTIQSLYRKTASQGDNVLFIRAFILECDNNDWQNQIFWIGLNRTNRNRYAPNVFIQEFGLLEKSKTDHTIPLVWKKKIEK